MNAKTEDAVIDVSVLEPGWTSSYLELEQVVKTAAYHVLDLARVPTPIKNRSIEASIVLANDDLTQVLNREYRGMDKPTNVLSFAALDSNDPVPEDGPFPIGDVILSYQTIDREARDQGKFFRDHFIHMVVHGMLHLLGYDHQNDDDANAMESLEIRILEKMNIQNPYTDNFTVA